MTSIDSDGELARSVDELKDEVRVLRDTVDELREVIEHLTLQIPHDFWQVLRDRRIDSMSRDPASPDFRTNTVPAEDVAAARDAVTGETAPTETDGKSAVQRFFSGVEN